MGVCVVENLSRVFLSEWPLLHLWVMRVYIVWVKGKKVTLKNPLDRMFRNYLAGIDETKYYSIFYANFLLLLLRG